MGRQAAKVTVSEIEKTKKKSKAKIKKEGSRFVRTIPKAKLKLIIKIKKTLSYLKKTAKTLKKTNSSRPKMYEKILNLSAEISAYALSGAYENLEKKWNLWEK